MKRNVWIPKLEEKEKKRQKGGKRYTYAPYSY
uniref:Uncharacterized protein n=1 Tax=Arundo donax TaxID=35708 RepID=A0A0A9D662_ARUDO